MLNTVAVTDGEWCPLSRDEPRGSAVYYRVRHGGLEWSHDPADFLTGGERPVPEPGTLLALVHGLAPPPDATPLPGVRRLALGTRVRVGAGGVTVSRRRPVLPTGTTDLTWAVAEVLRGLPEAYGPEGYGIAYSGGLSSAFLAVAALSAGHRPRLLHADLGLPGRRHVPPSVGDLTVRHIPVDVFELLDHHSVPTGGLMPPLPDLEFPRRLTARLAGVAGGGPLVAGTLLEDLVSARLPEAGRGPRDWRLLTCEPFHLVGTLPSLSEATALLEQGVVHNAADGAGNGAGAGTGHGGQDAQSVDGPPPPPPLGRRDLPGMTPKGRVALQTVQQASLSVWKDHLDFLGPLLGRADAGMTERVPGDHEGLVLPALDPGVLGAVETLPTDRLGRIAGGVFRNHQPLVRAVAGHRVRGLRRASSSFDLRLAAAAYLHRESDKIIAELERACALADLGLIDVAVVSGLLREGPGRADHALPLLRLLWIDQWLLHSTPG
ncbi:hypothetical protein ACFRCX_07245 [Streptomyces sp. NPDC056652]|uniref:hypothetical protein n=1 Tax=Streptomyces sp. NPDC056652 TaxID=3345893 RepID=UPI0036C4661A